MTNQQFENFINTLMSICPPQPWLRAETMLHLEHPMTEEGAEVMGHHLTVLGRLSRLIAHQTLDHCPYMVGLKLYIGMADPMEIIEALEQQSRLECQHLEMVISGFEYTKPKFLRSEASILIHSRDTIQSLLHVWAVVASREVLEELNDRVKELDRMAEPLIEKLFEVSGLDAIEFRSDLAWQEPEAWWALIPTPPPELGMVGEA